MTPAPEKKHIKEKGAAFDDALARATMKVRSCNKLVGLDKIRAPIAYQAALKATGYPVDSLTLPKNVGFRTQEMQDIAEALYADAVAAAQPKEEQP